MRVWDVAAGFLNRQSLLGEHRELHGLRSILVNGKKGYSRHPETLRWVGCVSGLDARHETLVAEMEVRGYVHRTPVDSATSRMRWPSTFVTRPADQLRLLKSKYVGRLQGRIALPRSVQELWGNYKYSVMARDPAAYRTIGRSIAGLRRGAACSAIAEELVVLTRERPGRRRLVNALEHMWGHVSKEATPEERRIAANDAWNMLSTIQRVVARSREPFLTRSTALSELAPFARELPPHRLGGLAEPETAP